MQPPKIISARKVVAVKVLIFAAAVIVGMAAYLYSERAKPVLYAYYYAGDPLREPAFTIFNPFRDRGPERGAEAFLEMLRAGRCEQAVAGLAVTDEYRQDTCEREKKYPLVSWRLMNRTEMPQGVKMYYHVWRDNHRDGYGSMWVTVGERGGRWEATDLDRFY